MNAIQDYFARYPRSVEVFQSEDGLLFHTRGAAESYGKPYERYSREQADATQEVTTIEVTEGATSDTDDSWIYSELTYQELRSRVKELGLKVEDYSRATLMATLMENDNQQKQQ